MHGQIARIDAKLFSVAAAMPLLVGVSVYTLMVAYPPHLLSDPDTYWQIAAGRWIFQHDAVPWTDPFSFTMRGAPWIAFEWLSELIYAAAFAAAGWTGIVVLAAAAIGLAFGLLSHLLLRALKPVPALVLTLAALTLVTPHMLARPHVLVLPVMVAWTGALVRAMDRQSGPPYLALPLLVLWANLHGSVIAGLGLIGPAVLEALVLGKNRRAWPSIILRWAPFTVLAIFACCLTPYGYHSLLIPLKTLGLGDALNLIQEWKPQNFAHLRAFEIVLLLGIFAASRGLTLPPLRTLVVLGLLHLALAHTRNADLLAMLAPLYLAAPLARKFGSSHNAGRQPLVPGLGVAAIVATVVATVHVATQPVAPAVGNTPQAAIEAAGLAKSGPVFNDYSFGGYLIYAGIPPFIDGRGELYGADFIRDYSRAIALRDIPGLLKMLDDYGIGATLLTPDTPAVALLDRMPGWQRVYSDDVAVVHKRRSAVSTHN